MTSFSKVQLKAIKKYCKEIIQDEIPNDFEYFGWKATNKNLATQKILSDKMTLSERDDQVSKIALMFLYTGFVKKDLKQYEGSILVADEYLRDIETEEDLIQDVKKCIKLKFSKEEPETVAERVFLDSTYAYYGEKGFNKRVKGTWEELNFLRTDKLDLLTSLENRYEDISQYKFYTTAASKIFDYRKAKNQIKLKAKIDKEKGENNLSHNKTAMTMFKTALRNHIDLINIADKKAGIMISINAILMTVMIPILGSYIIDVSKFIIPSVVLIITCGTAVILATLATRPQVSSGDISEDGIYTGEKSLFYFGNFFEMKKSDYRDAVKNVIVRDITLENSIINDLYDMGVILGLKYKKLRWCYIIFAVGIGLTLASFVFSFLLFPEI